MVYIFSKSNLFLAFLLCLCLDTKMGNVRGVKYLPAVEESDIDAQSVNAISDNVDNSIDLDDDDDSDADAGMEDEDDTDDVNSDVVPVSVNNQSVASMIEESNMPLQKATMNEQSGDDVEEDDDDDLDEDTDEGDDQSNE
jgi:hypothetical protein